MKRFLPFGLTLGFLLVADNTSVFAQAPFGRPASNPNSSPVFSPYLNLLRRDANPAVNYYGLVRPEKEFRQSLRTLQQDINAVQAATAAEDTAGLPVTGHPTQFMTFSHYFPSFGVSGGPGRKTTPQTQVSPTGTAAGTRPPRTR